jgi:ribosomal protein S18 acetylase RimI-like enzyme
VIQIRPLTPLDADAYTTIRREMLADAPWAFAASPESDIALKPGHLAASLAEDGFAIIGAFATAPDAPGPLLAVAGAHRNRHPKLAHRAHIWGVYTTPAARGRGLGRGVLAMVVEVARSWPGTTSIGLSASVRSPEAIRLYEAQGFRRWGVEPGAVLLDGCAYDEVHMVALFESRP